MDNEIAKELTNIHLTEKALVLRTISKLERRIECRKDISLDWLNPV